MQSQTSSPERLRRECKAGAPSQHLSEVVHSAPAHEELRTISQAVLLRAPVLPLSPRGLITLKGNLSYVLEPVPGLRTQHRLYRLEHLPMPKGSCGLPLSPPSTLHWLLPINHTRPRPPPHRVSWRVAEGKATRCHGTPPPLCIQESSARRTSARAVVQQGGHLSCMQPTQVP